MTGKTTTMRKQRLTAAVKVALKTVLTTLVAWQPAMAQQDLTFEATPEVPQMACAYTAVAPLIDGRDDDLVWQQAAFVDLVDVADLEGVPHSYATRVKMLWNQDALYVMFSASDADVWSTLKQRDEPLYNEEVVELFIDPDGDGGNYVEIEINPLGTVFDLLVTQALRAGGQALPAWDPDLRCAVHTEGTLNEPTDTDVRWSAEIALPWSALVTPLLDVPGSMSIPPTVGDRWRMNMYRYERLRVNGVATGVIQYSAWSPVGRIDFHVPDRFGVVLFAGARTAVEAQSWGHLKVAR